MAILFDNKTMTQSSLEIHLKNSINKTGYAFVPYIAAGDPDWETSKKLVQTLIEAGADTIEIGLPFTDPVADGPVLQRSFKRVLSHNFKLEEFFSFLSDIHTANPEFPFLVMGYANIFYHMGFAKFLKKLLNYNVVGVVIPDIPFEEKARLIKNLQLGPYLQRISWIDFITPTTTEDRLEKICKQASGFLYFVSTKGVTGQSKFSLKPWKRIIGEIKKRTTVPVLTGFGIRNAENALEATQLTDGFIIGSRLHEIIEENLENPLRIPDSLRMEISGILPEYNR